MVRAMMAMVWIIPLGMMVMLIMVMKPLVLTGVVAAPTVTIVVLP